MENFKFTIFLIVAFAILFAVGYWGFSTIQSGSYNVASEQVKKLTQDNKDLTTKISDLSTQIDTLQSQLAEKDQIIKNQTVSSTQTKIHTSTSKYQNLINKLQKLVVDRILMKKGSTGTRVGTVQNFLNIYNNTSNRIDNDYGKGTEDLIKKFQKDMKLTSDGEAGPGTFKKMISWLNTR